MKKILISALCFVFYTTSNAQFENILIAGEEDLSKYLGNYAEPMFKGVIYNLNNGWYHSGKTHKKFGFDITINATASFVPDKDKSFLFNNDDFNVLSLSSGTSENLPTLFGTETSENIQIRIPIDSDNQNIIFDHLNAAGIPVDENDLPIPSFDGYLVANAFNAPNGIEDDLPIAAVPTPMVQVGLGLPGKTDIKLRFIPSVGNEEVKTSLIGVGLQHNLLQHFSKLDIVPIFDLSILGAFTSSTTNYEATDSNIAGSNQETEVKINAYTVQLVGNANFKIVNFYAGLGYVTGDATFTAKGEYIFDYDKEDLNGNIISIPDIVINDPIDIKYKIDSGIKATLGVRLNLAWFKIFADYSIQEYNTLNTGIAFSFR